MVFGEIVKEEAIKTSVFEEELVVKGASWPCVGPEEKGKLAKGGNMGRRGIGRG